MGIFDDMENFIFDRFSVTKRQHNVQHQHRVISISSNSTTSDGQPQQQQQQQQQHIQQHHQNPSPPVTHRSSSTSEETRPDHSGDRMAEQQRQQQQSRMHQSPQQIERQLSQRSQQQSLHQHHQIAHHISHQQQQRQQQQQQQQQQNRPQSMQQQQNPQHSHKPLQRCSSHPQPHTQPLHQHHPHPHPPHTFQNPPQPVSRSHSRSDVNEYPATRSSPHSSLPNSPTVPRTGSGQQQPMTSARTDNSPVSHRRPQHIGHSRIPSSSPFRDRMSWHESRSRPPTGISELHSPQQEQHRGFPSPARSRHRASWVELSNLSGTFDFPTTVSSSPHPLRRSASTSSPSSKPDSPTSAAVYNNVNNNNLSRPPSAGLPDHDHNHQQQYAPSSGNFHSRRAMSTTSLTARSPSTERPPTPSSLYDNNNTNRSTPTLPPSPSLSGRPTPPPPLPKLDSPTSPQKQNLKNEKTISVTLPSTFRSEPQLASLDRPACMVAGGGELPQFAVPTQQTHQSNGVVITKICRPKLVRLRSEPSSPLSSHSGPSSSSSTSPPFVAADPQSPQSAIRCRRRRRDELKRSQSLEVTSSGTNQEELWTGINVPNQLVITRPQLSRADVSRRHLSLHLDCGSNGAINACCSTPEGFTSCMSGDVGSGRAYPPLLFHDTHGDNIELLNGKMRARRHESFCKGICFSNRPVHVNEKIYVKFVETNTSWSGVLRFGFTSIDPATISGQELPRYACPDLTNKPGNWAKALGERYTTSNILLHFSVNAAGDVTYGVNGEEKGLFFSSVVTTGKLWAMLDVYGNTVTVEFSSASAVYNDPEPNMGGLSSLSSLSLEAPGTPTSSASTIGGDNRANSNAVQPAVRFHAGIPLTTMPLHALQGRNVRILGEERRVAARLESEYCNSLIFSNRPMKFGETIVIQVLSVDRSYIGGLGFGLTACNPSDVDPSSLPDDSDYLLDRLEYWVVNKDVCSAPEIGDELSFFLTLDGAVKYSRNGLPQVTLMHVDKTLPLWVFFDVYGNIQKIKLLGCTMNPVLYPYSRPTSGTGGGLSVAMPSSSSTTAHNRPTQGGAIPPQLLNLRSNSEPEGQHTPLKEEYSAGQTSSLPPTPSGMSEGQDEDCHVCYENLVNCVIYKCGHMCLCFSCAEQIKNQKGLCPICRNPITDLIRVYRS